MSPNDCNAQEPTLFNVPVRLIVEEQRRAKAALPIYRKLFYPELTQAERRKAYNRAKLRSQEAAIDPEPDCMDTDQAVQILGAPERMEL